MLLMLLVVAAADAAEVLWLDPPSEADRARVADQAGAVGPPLGAVELLAATTRWTEADDRALRDVDAALAQARTFEATLDGELLILRDLDAPVARVGALRDDADRGHLFAALAYQGFAANRFFGDELATATDAAPWRVELDGRAMERPWVDAVALEPDRDASPYEIAEAPQRVAYARRRADLAAVLPATLTPAELPPGATLRVDGRVTTPGPSGNVKVLPGRHLVQLEQGGLIVARWDVRVGPTEDRRLEPELGLTELQRWLSTVTPGGAVPAPIASRVEALGGELWLARAGATGPDVLAVSASGVRAVTLAAEEVGPSEPSDRDGRPVELSVGALGGWFTSADFYLQDPVDAPRTVGTVNAVALGGWVGADLALGPLRAGAGVDVLATPGEHHRALYGEHQTAVRPIPHLAVGIRPAQLCAGYLLPYHPAVGGRLRAAVGPLEARLVGWAGLGTDRTRADGTVWEGSAVYTVAGGLGARF